MVQQTKLLGECVKYEACGSWVNTNRSSAVGREVNINGVAAHVAATCVWEHSSWKLRIRNMYFCAIIYWRLQIAKLEIEA